jgi:signal transduction histidine kinase
VLIYAEVLLRELPKDAPHRTELEIIIREINRCKTTVASLLDFARQHQVEVQEIDLNGLITNTVDVEQMHDIYKNISIRQDLDHSLPQIQADPTQLRAVFINLLSNAAEAMPKGGVITISTASGPKDMVTITVEDTGEGIAPENSSKLFTPFFTTKPLGKGIGLGLAITYGIVKMHHGQIQFNSELGEGTIFTIRLPVQLPATSTAKLLNNPLSDQKKMLR